MVGWAHGVWRMEEASVAGESPDRSKQHESSAEPTSGGTAPVPDPRLAVAREAVTAAARVDTATAVFSAKRSADSTGSAGSVAAGASPGSDGSPEPGAAEKGAAEGTEGGNGRLRDVVAAWVAGADEERPDGASGSAGADSSAPDASDDSGDDVEAVGELSDTDAAEGSDGVAVEDVSDAEGSGGRGADSDDDDDDDEAGADAEASSAGTGTTGTGPDSLDDVDVDSESEDAVSAAAPAEDVLAGVTPDETPSEAAVDGTADGDGAEDSEDDRPVAGAEPGDSTDAAREPEDEPEDEPERGADVKADAESEAKGEPGGDASGDGDGDGDADSGEEAPEPRVDQPTATFQVRPPATDQPTTMLKLGDAKPKPGPDANPDARSDKDAAPKPGGKPAAEAPSERTSRFVALKPLDAPLPLKPTPPPVAAPTAPPAAETAAIPQVGPERTTQQPLPPKPPLDLLAELTNTPPPLQTPVRTIVRRIRIWTPLVLLLAVVLAVVQAVRPLPTPALTLTADESYAFEGEKVSLPWPDEGQGWMDVNGIGTVDDFGEQTPVAIGSVAKAMTAYLILRNHPLKAGEEGKQIPVDAKAETEGGYDKEGESTLNTVQEGDTLTEKQALAAVMIPSANNIARLLARWDSNGSEEAFVKKMNDAAKDLGMNDTTYTDPSGLKETTVSTAEDQVKLGNELVKMQALVDITKLPSWKDPSGQVWQNYNRLVPYDGAIGIKTGTTTKAGGNLLFAATKEVGGETVTVVGAILGQHKPPIIDTVNAVSRTAMIAAQDALTSRKILKKGDAVGYVDDGLGGRTPVVATKDVSAVGWAGKTVKLKLSEDGTTIPHEAKAGTRVGSLSVGDGTGDAVEIPVALQSDLTEPGYGAKLTRVG
jgi:serine-type D-Ala-D-Ala carboxypeptidase (penicillin-binding protein 5/6)